MSIFIPLFAFHLSLELDPDSALDSPPSAASDSPIDSDGAPPKSNVDALKKPKPDLPLKRDVDSPKSSKKSEDPTAETSPQENLAAYWGTLTDEQLQKDIVELQNANKYNAAQDRLDFLVQRNPMPYHRYLWAKNNELLEHYQLALTEYDALLTLSDLDDGWYRDIHYRRGIVLDDLGRHFDAISAFKKARWAKGLSTSDKKMIDLLIGSARINAGRSWCGVWTINRALSFFESGTEASWARARARTALLKELIASSESRTVRPGKKISEDIAYRQRWLNDAEAQTIGIIQLQEPEYVQKAFVLLIDAYMRFYDEVVYAPPPIEFDPFQQVIYRQKMKEQAEPLRYRAKRLAVKALNYADATEWQGLDRDALYRRRVSIEEEASLP